MGNFRLITGLYIKAQEDMKADLGDGVLHQGQSYQCMCAPIKLGCNSYISVVGVNGVFDIEKLKVELLYELPPESDWDRDHK